MSGIESPASLLDQPRPLLEQLVAESGECAALIDRNYNHLIVSEGYASCFGRRRHQIEGSSLARWWRADQYDELRVWIEQALGGVRVQRRLTMGCAESGRRPYQVSIRPLDIDGAKTALFRASDITGQISAQAARMVSEARFADFAELVDGCFWETDASLRLTYVSRRALKVFGSDAGDLVGEPVARLGKEWKQFLVANPKARLVRQFDYEWVRPDEVERLLAVSHKPVADESGAFAGYRGVVLDVTESRRFSDQLEYQAKHDPLTGLINRRHFERKLGAMLVRAKQNLSEHALCFMDLDRFKKVNDSVGHMAGDEMLRQLALVLQSNTRRSDTLSRLGGDEFCLLLEDCSVSQARQVARKLIKAVDEFHFVWEGQSFRVHISVGLVPITHQSKSSTSLLGSADKACYAAKQRGGNGIETTAA